MKKKTVKDVEMHNFSVCAYKSQDFAQSEKNFAPSHDRETVTFRNSDFQLKKKTIYGLQESIRQGSSQPR